MAKKAIATPEGGVHVDLTDAEIEEIAAREAQAVKDDAAYLLVKYRDDRKAEYPSYAEQFDLIYHSGIDAWKAKIKETKDKYPKGGG